jgi:hypothetical protein
LGAFLALALGVMQLTVASLVAVVIWVLLPVNGRTAEPDPETYFLQLVEPAVLILRCDRTKETREACNVRKRMEKVKARKG